MLRFAPLLLCLAFSSCSIVPTSSKAWKAHDFERASNPEMVGIAAACLRHRFAGLQSWSGDYFYYLHVQNADWRVVLDQSGIPLLKRFMFGSRDHFWSDEGYRDRATGLRVYMIDISLEGKFPLAEKAQAYVTLGVGTNLAGSGDLYTLEKKGGQWVVIKAEKQWVARTSEPANKAPEPTPTAAGFPQGSEVFNAIAGVAHL